MASVPSGPYGGDRRNQGPAFPGGRRIGVLIGHPEPAARATLRHQLDGRDRIDVVGVAGDGSETVDQAYRLRPAVVLIDDRLAAASHAERLARFSRVIMLIPEAEPTAIASMMLGPARGYLVYDNFEPDDVSGAVRAVADGLAWLSPVAAAAAATALRTPARAARFRLDSRDPYGPRLTGRERDVLELLCLDMSTAGIATALGLTEKTVRNHLNRCYAKLGVRDRAEATRRLAQPVRPPDSR